MDMCLSRLVVCCLLTRHSAHSPWPVSNSPLSATHKHCDTALTNGRIANPQCTNTCKEGLIWPFTYCKLPGAVQRCVCTFCAGGHWILETRSGAFHNQVSRGKHTLIVSYGASVMEHRRVARKRGSCVQLARWGFVHITQCRGLVTNGSNHWILHQPDQVSKTDTMARGTRGPICGNQ